MDLHGEYLARGVSWSAHAAALALSSGRGESSQFHHQPLAPGTALRFRILTPAGSRSCLGYSTVEGPTVRTQLPCRDGSEAVRGFQCERCFVRDDFRFMHDITAAE